MRPVSLLCLETASGVSDLKDFYVFVNIKSEFEIFDFLFQTKQKCSTDWEAPEVENFWFFFQPKQNRTDWEASVPVKTVTENWDSKLHLSELSFFTKSVHRGGVRIGTFFTANLYT